MTKLILAWHLITGTVCTYPDVDGTKLYAIHLQDNTCIEHAYKSEVLQWIKTKEFQYDDTLEDKVLPQP